MKFSFVIPIFLTSLLLNAQTVRIKDNSDWWSLLNEKFDVPQLKVGNQDIKTDNFQIAGITLDTQFNQIVAKLGKAVEVERGDASTGRHQLCYTSADSPGKMHLVFEFGEVESIFYLFSGGADWKGSGLCAKTKQVSMSSRTASGLRLGLTETQVVAILGKPDMAEPNRLLYSREIEHKTTPEEFQHLRKDYPESLTDQEAHEKFDSYDVQIYIEARFSHSKLSYLAVSNTEGID